MTYRVFVSTYAKYNSGHSTKGEWLDLEDYACNQDFYEACAELHSDEGDPEFMFLDFEDIPGYFTSESHLDVELWGYIDSPIDDEVKAAYVEAKDRWDEDDCQSSYIGEFDNFTRLAEYLVDEQGLLEALPERLQYYFDYEAYGRDLRLGGDVVEENGHFFWSH